jgi:Sec-independent protein translocase protein TatA
VLDLSGGKLIVILSVALIVFGDKLPEAVRKFGRLYGELRRMSQGFQSDIREALDEPMREVRDTMNTVTGGFTGGAEPPPGIHLQGTAPGPTTDDGGIATPDSDPSAQVGSEPPTGSHNPDATVESTAPQTTGVPDHVVPAAEPIDDFEPFPAVPSPPETMLVSPARPDAFLAGALHGDGNGHGPNGADQTDSQKWP